MIINFEPLPVLESDRLSLRKMTEADANEVFAIRSDAETMKYIPRPLARNKEDALALIELWNQLITANESINIAITLKEDDKLIGMICLINIRPENSRSEIGYVLHPDAHGKGIMHEAVQIMINYAFNVLGFHSLEALIDPANVASEKVLLKHNFVKEAHFRENRYHNGKYLDSVIYSILNQA